MRYRRKIRAQTNQSTCVTLVHKHRSHRFSEDRTNLNCMSLEKWETGLSVVTKFRSIRLILAELREKMKI